jgi:RNA polymerase sigma-70 factor (ECF subfamily)
MKILSLWCRTDALQDQLEKMRPKLYRVAYSWSHNAALADDLVQEALIKALQNAKQLRNAESVNGWLFAILANCWRDHFRQNREMDDVEAIERIDEFTPEDGHAQSQLVSRVRNAIARLPLGQRQVLTLVDLEEFSYAEVSAILEIPVGTVMSRLCRARNTLKTLLCELAPQQAEVSQIRRIRSV